MPDPQPLSDLPGPSPTPTPAPTVPDIDHHNAISDALDDYATVIKNQTDRPATLGDISKFTTELAKAFRIEAE